MKFFKNMEKKTKKAILIITSITLFVTTGGGIFYANEVNNLVQQTQQLYWAVELPTEEQQEDFNGYEQYKYDVILSNRYYAFHEKDIKILETIQPRIDDLQTEVTYRKLQDKLDKVALSEKANKTEQETFTKKRDEISALIKKQEETKKITTEIEVLIKLKDTTDNRLKKEQEDEQVKAESEKKANEAGDVIYLQVNVKSESTTESSNSVGSPSNWADPLPNGTGELGNESNTDDSFTGGSY